jgi:hypothetical protein
MKSVLSAGPFMIFIFFTLLLMKNPKFLYKTPCRRRHSERYDNTGLFTVIYQLIYRHCTCTVKGSGSTSD